MTKDQKETQLPLEAMQAALTKAQMQEAWEQFLKELAAEWGAPERWNVFANLRDSWHSWSVPHKLCGFGEIESEAQGTFKIALYSHPKMTRQSIIEFCHTVINALSEDKDNRLEKG